jgi:hypothetical protein
VPPTSDPDVVVQALETTDDIALLEAAMGSGRGIAGGITHDLNSALQCLGDALFAIRDDAQIALENGTTGADVAMASLAPSLSLADEAFSRISSLALVIPNLVPRVGEETGPIKLEAELQGLVALTRHHWRNRIHILIEIEPEIRPFWCAWWIVRLATVRLLLAAIESQRAAAGHVGREDLPRVRIVATQHENMVSLRVFGDGRPIDPSRPATTGDELDAILLLCARRLGGDVRTITNDAGAVETVFRFPVLRSPSTDNSQVE